MEREEALAIEKLLNKTHHRQVISGIQKVIFEGIAKQLVYLTERTTEVTLGDICTDPHFAQSVALDFAMVRRQDYVSDQYKKQWVYDSTPETMDRIIEFKKMCRVKEARGKFPATISLSTEIRTTGGALKPKRIRQAIAHDLTANKHFFDMLSDHVRITGQHREGKNTRVSGEVYLIKAEV